MSKRTKSKRRKPSKSKGSTPGPNGAGGPKKRVVSGQVMKQLRLSSRVSGIEQHLKQAQEGEAARARVILDMTFAVNAMSRRLAYHDKMLVFDPDMLEFAMQNPEMQLTLQDLVDLLVPVPVISMEDLNSEREKCMKEFHEEETRRREAEERMRKETAEAVESKTLDDRCSQCGKAFKEEPCGPTHATIMFALQQRDNVKASEPVESPENVSPSTEEVDLDVSDDSLPFCTECGEDVSSLNPLPEDCPACGLPLGAGATESAPESASPAETPAAPPAVSGATESAATPA